MGVPVSQTPRSASAARSPANRLGIDYRAAPQRRVGGPIIDFHTHVNDAVQARPFFEAADAYGISKVVSMTPLPQAEAVLESFPGRVELIAIPNWRRDERGDGFREEWVENLRAFRRLGARLCKFWMAPPMRGRYGITLDSDFVQPVIREALDLGYEFMVHVGDPSVWWAPGARYADVAQFGTKPDQYPPLERFLDAVAPRNVVAAHMGGSVEDPPFLQGLLDRHANLWLDTSATKWIVREVSRRPDEVRDFVLRNADRILFGSDVVVGEKFDFEHYASRYWAQQMMWESDYAGESPIDDPDALPVPRLAGLSLPPDVLTRLYRDNAARLGYRA